MNADRPIPINQIDNDVLAYQDTVFLQREELRSSRLALEFTKADLGMRDQGIKSTIVVFGSARTPEDHPDYIAAREFGRIASERGGALNEANGGHINVICTGGGPGIMEAANRGAHDAGALSIGLNIELPHEQGVNPYVTPELSFQFQYFALRKMHFAIRANALVAFPGGFGTLDELFDILTLKQTGKISGMPIILFGRAFWSKIINIQALIDYGTIAAGDVSHFRIVDSAEECWEAIIEHGLALTHGDV
ncbi:TIGR00730 family Rossman fold protein [Cohaesibacter celericrescens]|uniref:Cytokinin riboside 5'-monophosphate phosphoribohydrolase n=1 Tax=Cohaesibacter celericrescens TaxID=2067669 RepID=A0A2N5XQV4_9HYPH|nr:TIGR00730 family Rossman fold protein [Cohaesibacter celericrescens]PLW76884.1 TIGR00730 family Rossman fold protein [Cohaesibacter celericrescens]